jgi:sulfatase maturation enzyme AslB (radical SAM superfamily)
MKVIKDEFSGVKMSRQRRWQLRKQRDGCCFICGLAALPGGYCLKHLVMQRELVAKRQGRKRQNRGAMSYRLEAQMKKRGVSIFAAANEVEKMDSGRASC